MEIDEVEAYIESENHLPWVTSAQNEEENAVNMTRMGFETLEALENLQMQIIKLNREVQQLREENRELKAKINEEL